MEARKVDGTAEWELATGCLKGDPRAWRTFVQGYGPVIGLRIKQVFARCGFRYGDGDFEEAHAWVMDHFTLGRALKGFKGNGSLEAWVRKVATNSVIDWYRARRAEKRLGGATPGQVAELVHEAPAAAAEQCASLFNDLRGEERLYVALMLIRYRSLEDEEWTELARVSGRSLAKARSMVDDVEARVASRTEPFAERMGALNVLYVQLHVLRLRETKDPEMIERKELRLKALQGEISAKGFDPFPTRQEMAEMLNWDVNKVDRLAKKVKERLAP